MPRKSKRRTHGEGSRYTRVKGGITYYVVQAPGEGGKQFSSRVSFAEAAKKRDLFLASTGNIGKVAARGTVAALMGAWLASVEGDLREKTYDDYATVIRLHILPAIGNIKVSALKPHHIREMLVTIQKAGFSKSLERKAYDRLNQALERAVKDELIPKNPCWPVDAPVVSGKRVEPIVDDDLSGFMDRIERDRLRALWLLYLAMGPRRGEALGIDRERDLELWQEDGRDRGRITIRRGLQRVRGHLVFNTPKTDTGTRTYDLPEMVATAIRQHLTHQKEERLKLGAAWSGEYRGVKLLFCTKVGTPLEPRNVLRRFKELCPGYHVHSARHTAASFLLADGGDIKAAQHILGHSNATDLLNRYGHLLTGRTAAAASRQDEALRKWRKK